MRIEICYALHSWCSNAAKLYSCSDDREVESVSLVFMQGENLHFSLCVLTAYDYARRTQGVQTCVLTRWGYAKRKIECNLLLTCLKNAEREYRV